MGVLILDVVPAQYINSYLNPCLDGSTYIGCGASLIASQVLLFSSVYLLIVVSL
jgi:hypothetical protein